MRILVDARVKPIARIVCIRKRISAIGVFAASDSIRSAAAIRGVSRAGTPIENTGIRDDRRRTAHLILRAILSDVERRTAPRNHRLNALKRTPAYPPRATIDTPAHRRSEMRPFTRHAHLVRKAPIHRVQLTGDGVVREPDRIFELARSARKTRFARSGIAVVAGIGGVAEKRLGRKDADPARGVARRAAIRINGELFPQTLRIVVATAGQLAATISDAQTLRVVVVRAVCIRVTAPIDPNVSAPAVGGIATIGGA
jgi:hypothetical protein